MTPSCNTRTADSDTTTKGDQTMTQHQYQPPAKKPMSREAKTGWIILGGFGVFILGIVVGVGINTGTDSAASTTTSVTSKAPAKTVAAKPASVIPDDGIYLVGVDVQPGQYRSGDDADCYWARLRKTGGDSGSIIANNNGGNQVVTIAATDKAFETKRCGGWRKIG